MVKEKGNVREMRKRIAACVYYVLFTLYKHIHMYTVYAQLEVKASFSQLESQYYQPGCCSSIYWVLHNTIRLAFVLLIIPSPKRRSYVVTMKFAGLLGNIPLCFFTQTNTPCLNHSGPWLQQKESNPWKIWNLTQNMQLNTTQRISLQQRKSWKSIELYTATLT